MAPSSFRCYGQIVPATGAPRRMCAKGETVTRARMDELCELCADPSQPKLYKARRVSCTVEPGSFGRGEGNVLLYARVLFEFSRGAWHYNWLSSRNGPNMKHQLHVFFFAEYSTGAADTMANSAGGGGGHAVPGWVPRGVDGSAAGGTGGGGASGGGVKMTRGQSTSPDAMAIALIGLGASNTLATAGTGAGTGACAGGGATPISPRSKAALAISALTGSIGGAGGAGGSTVEQMRTVARTKAPKVCY